MGYQEEHVVSGIAGGPRNGRAPRMHGTHSWGPLPSIRWYPLPILRHRAILAPSVIPWNPCHSWEPCHSWDSTPFVRYTAILGPHCDSWCYLSFPAPTGMPGTHTVLGTHFHSWTHCHSWHPTAIRGAADPSWNPWDLRYYSWDHLPFLRPLRPAVIPATLETFATHLSTRKS